MTTILPFFWTAVRIFFHLILSLYFVQWPPASERAFQVILKSGFKPYVGTEIVLITMLNDLHSDKDGQNANILILLDISADVWSSSGLTF